MVVGTMSDWNVEEQASLKEEVALWIEWARRRLPSAGDMPPIFRIEPIFNAGWRVDAWWEKAEEVPWKYNSDFETDYGCYDVSQEGASHLCERCLPVLKDLDLADLATRFVALSVCYELAHYEPALLNANLASNIRELHQNNLAQLIRLVPVDLLDDWRTIRWEILNAYVISDWDRALALYDQAEKLKLLPAGEIQALRGQFRFLAALGKDIKPPLNSLSWPPEVYCSTSVEASLLFLLGLVHVNTRTGPADFDREMLIDARVDLEKAVAKQRDLAPAYRAVLARCYFLTEQFSNAANEYVQLLSEHLEILGDDRRCAVYGAAATSLQCDRQTDKAREISERWLAKYPDDPEALRLMAEMEAGACDYKAAYYYLHRLVELKPELQEDVGYSGPRILDQ